MNFLKFISLAFFWCYGYALCCPKFVEFFPDPTEVPDSDGEFIEIRLDSLDGPQKIQLQLDEKAPFEVEHFKGDRLLLVHDSSFCEKNVECGVFSLTLPNSKETSWVLKTESCKDSVFLPKPKPGKAFQRKFESDTWELVEPTKGFANPLYELGVKNCGIFLGNTYKELLLSGCDSSFLWIKITELFSQNFVEDSMKITSNISLDLLFDKLPKNSSYKIEAKIPQDEVSLNDHIDTLIITEKAPLKISEIHHCPEEPEPEWVEIYNQSAFTLPLKKFKFCNRSKEFPLDSIYPFQSVIFTRDSLQLREFIGYKDVALAQLSMGYLNNTQGSISICIGDFVVDSVSWDKHTASCPNGFNPLTGAVENSPGFIGKKNGESLAEEPFTYKISSRVLRINKSNLQVYIESSSLVSLKLLDSAGRTVWKNTVAPKTGNWFQIPLKGLSVGIAYVSISVGKFEKLIGILLRP